MTGRAALDLYKTGAAGSVRATPAARGRASHRAVRAAGVQYRTNRLSDLTESQSDLRSPMPITG